MIINKSLIFSFLISLLISSITNGQGFKLPWKNGIQHIVSRTSNNPVQSGPHSSSCSPNSAYNGFTPHSYIAIDFDTPNGVYDEVRAAKAGTVIFAGLHTTLSSGYGRLVKIRHSDNTITYYAHNQQIFVTVGQVVDQGCLIADGGTTGNSTGDHIHFEWRDVGDVAFSDRRYPSFTECGCFVHAKYCYTSTNTLGSCNSTPCTPPVNDDCSSATLVSSNGPTLSGTVECASGSLGANTCTGCNCMSPDDLDVYYKFIAAATSHTITLSNYESNFDGLIELRSGCGSGLNIGCHDPSGSPSSVVNTFNGLTIGQTYYIRIMEWDNIGSPPSSPTFDIKVTHTACNSVPNITSINGNSNVCSNSSNTYSIAPVNGATSYTWTLPSGWTGTSTSPSITTTVGNSGGQIKVKANNACGSSNEQVLQVNVSGTLASPGAINGSVTVCENSTNVYSVSAVLGATSYTWTLPSGWSGVSTSSSISLIAGSNNGQISVKANNSCGSSVIETKQVLVNKLPSIPGNITGNSITCKNFSEGYSIIPVSNATSYTWEFPSGWIGNSTNTSVNAITGSSGGLVSVKANNACGSSALKSLQVNIVEIDNSVSVYNNELTALETASRVSYQWINCSDMQPVIGERDQDFIAFQNGNYALSLRLDGCVDTSDCFPVTTVGFLYYDQKIKLMAYPNPATNQINLSASGLVNDNYKITLTNIKGQKLIERDFTIQNSTLETQLDISKFSKGMYHVSINSINWSHTFTIEKQ